MKPRWYQKTWWNGGGDTYYRDTRFYRYRYIENLRSLFSLPRYTFNLQFDTVELNTNGDSNGHRSVLTNPDFAIRGINVMEWARDVVRGKAEFEFVIDVEEVSASRKDIKTLLQANFTHGPTAMLFKLTFGGK